MILHLYDFACKRFSFIYPLAARAFIIAKIEYLIHSGMKSIGFVYITKLVDNCKHFMNIGMKRTILFAVKEVVVWPDIFQAQYAARQTQGSGSAGFLIW